MVDTDMAAAVHTVVGDTGPMDSFFKKICRSPPLLLSYPIVLPISDLLTHIENAFQTLLASGLLFWFHHASLRFSKITRNPSPLKNLFIG